MKLHKLVPRYLRHLKVLNRTAATLEAERERLRRFVRFLEGMGIEEPEGIGKDVLRAYAEELSVCLSWKGEPLRVSTQRNLLVAARSFLTWLYRQDLVAVDLSAVLELPREEQPLPKEVIEPREIRRLLASIDVTTPLGLRDRAMVEVFYSTGVRVSELCGLEEHDVDLDGGFVHVRLGKGRKDRVVPMGEIACEAVRVYLAQGRPWLVRDEVVKVLFLSARGRKLCKRSVAERVHHLVREAGIRKRITPHCFRVSCTTGMLRGGANVRYLQEMLGHASVDSLDPYLKLTATELKAMHAKHHPRERMDP